MTEYKDRTKEFRTVPAKSIRLHPDNPRLHTGKQKNALKYVLDKVGIASVPICYDDPEFGLTLIDGHLRQETLDQDIKVVVLDVTPEEAKLLLLTMDQIGGMATLDQSKVNELFGETYDPAGEHLRTMQMLFESLHPGKEQKLPEPEPTAELPDAESPADLYPITPELHEKYDYVTILCETEREFAALCSFLGVVREKSWKSSAVGTGRVKLFRDVAKILGIES